MASKIMFEQFLDTFNKISLLAYVGTSVMNTRWGKKYLAQRQEISSKQVAIQLTQDEEEMIKLAAHNMDEMLRLRGHAALAFSKDGKQISVPLNNEPISFEDQLNAFCNNHPTIMPFISGILPGVLTGLGSYLLSDEISALDATMNGVSMAVSSGLALTAFINYKQGSYSNDLLQDIRKVYISNRLSHNKKK